MRFSISVSDRKHLASSKIVGSMLAIATMWLMLVATSASAYGQISNEVSNSATTPSPADWTQFHRDNMQRWNPYETVLGANNVRNLKLKWRNPLGEASISSPGVVNGVLYFGGEDLNVYALNASTGAELWSYQTGGFVDSSPAVANGLVYI
jgi:outer membrane protein assembly factor BamB